MVGKTEIVQKKNNYKKATKPFTNNSKVSYSLRPKLSIVYHIVAGKLEKTSYELAVE